MGEGCREALRVEFDRSVKVEFHGANVTSDAGLLAFRRLDEALGLTDMVAQSQNITHHVTRTRARVGQCVA